MPVATTIKEETTLRAKELIQELIKAYGDDYLFSMQIAKKYIKIFHTCAKYPSQHGGSIYAFIDNEGNLYKPASYSAPAKHVRSNIFADDLGMSACNRYSVKYLRD